MCQRVLLTGELRMVRVTLAPNSVALDTHFRPGGASQMQSDRIFHNPQLVPTLLPPRCNEAGADEYA
jgi:hypothetical protein